MIDRVWALSSSQPLSLNGESDVVAMLDKVLGSWPAMLGFR